MSHEEETPLSAEEASALNSLRREMPVSHMLEARIIRALKNDGHLGAVRTRKNSIPIALKIAAAIALFAGGVATGRYVLANESRETALLGSPAELRDIPTSRPPAAPTQSHNGETVVAEREVWF